MSFRSGGDGEGWRRAGRLGQWHHQRGGTGEAPAQRARPADYFDPLTGVLEPEDELDERAVAAADHDAVETAGGDAVIDRREERPIGAVLPVADADSPRPRQRMGHLPPHRRVDRDLDEIVRRHPCGRPVTIEHIEELAFRPMRAARQVLEIDHVQCANRSRRSQSHHWHPLAADFT